MVSVLLLEEVATTVILLDSLGALNNADASGFELLTIMLNRSLTWITGSFIGALSFSVTSGIPGK